MELVAAAKKQKSKHVHLKQFTFTGFLLKNLEIGGNFKGSRSGHTSGVAEHSGKFCTFHYFNFSSSRFSMTSGLPNPEILWTIPFSA